jgi:hypothetical protein
MFLCLWEEGGENCLKLNSLTAGTLNQRSRVNLLAEGLRRGRAAPSFVAFYEMLLHTGLPNHIYWKNLSTRKMAMPFETYII